MSQQYDTKHKPVIEQGKLSALGGMVLVHELLDRTGTMSASDSILGAPGSGRGRSNSGFVGTFVQMFLSGCG